MQVSETRPANTRDLDWQRDGRNETLNERSDRNLQELLNELRVALPGIQILFGFLLIVPFSQRFGQVTQFQEKLYFAVLLLTGIATALLIAPTALHRVLFRLQMKEVVVEDSQRLMLAGLVVLALAMTGAVLLVTDVLFGSVACAIAAGATGTMFGLLWFGLPLKRRSALGSGVTPGGREEERRGG